MNQLREIVGSSKGVGQWKEKDVQVVDAKLNQLV